MKKRIPNYVFYLFKVYFLGLLVLSALRIVELYLNWDLTQSITPELKLSYFWKTLFLGIRFDTVIMVYFLALPFLVLFFNDLFFKNNKKVLGIVRVLIVILFSILFFIGGVDIPYFNHFNYRLTAAALMYMDNPAFVFGMIFQEPSYWLVLIPIMVLIYSLIKLNKHFMLHSFQSKLSLNIPTKLLCFFGMAAILFLGLRGKLDLEESPLGPVDAYYSDYSIMNQMSLNPAFTFLKSYISQNKSSNKDLQLIDDDLAIHEVQKLLGRTGNDYSPIVKTVYPDSIFPNQPNVVLIMMEGLSAIRLKAFGSDLNCTPFLDSLAKQSVLYKNIFSSGIHTHNGIYSTLTSYPALFERHALKQIPILRYNSLPQVLKNNDYATIYFTNHDVEFDNVGGFLTENGIDELVSDRIYPADKVLSSMGVTDNFMFQYSIPYLNELGKKKNPFLSVFMTTSNHRPYVIPDWYPKRFNDSLYRSDEYNAIAFADESLRRFMENAKKQDWFENTIFVLISDHGWKIEPQYDLSINHSYVPLLFYSPKYLSKPRIENKMGGQIDVFPSILGLLNLKYENNTLGIDLFKESRPYIYFNADNKIGVIDQKYLYIYRKDGPESLHLYPSTENIIEQLPSKAEEMKKYAFSNMQTASYLIKKNRVGGGN